VHPRNAALRLADDLILLLPRIAHQLQYRCGTAG
jgi:hypothetical protein